MLVELAVGDAYGAGFEYADPDFVAAHNTLEGYVQNPSHPGVRSGSYTDDTQMTIAIAELMVSGDPWTARRFADQFVAVFHRDERQGYAGGFYQLRREVRDGEELLARINPASDKSGAAMRAGPIGLLPSVADVLHHSAVQARVTHDTPAGIEAAQAAALVVHYCHYELGPTERVGQWIDEQLWSAGGAGGWSRPWRGKVGSRGWMSVRAALTAISTCSGLSEILRTCVAFTGDVDTVATIALAAASRSPQITRDLPKLLVRGLEDGPYGRGYLLDLDARLLSSASPDVVDPAGAYDPSLLGSWSDDSLYQGAMEAHRVVFMTGGAGRFENSNALATEVQHFAWETAPAKGIRIHFVRYEFQENPQPPASRPHWESEPVVMTARVGPGTDALDRDVTVLTLEDPTGHVRRYARQRRDR